MLVCAGKAGGVDVTIIGLARDNLDRLLDDKPIESAIEGLPHIFILFGETLRDVVAKLVDVGWLPQSALDEYVAPADDRSVTTWDPASGTKVQDIPPAREQRPAAPEPVVHRPELPGGRDDEPLGDAPPAELDEATAAFVGLVRAARAHLAGRDPKATELAAFLHAAEQVLEARGVEL